MSSDDKKRYLILKDPRIMRGIFILSIPIMIQNFMRTLHDLVDTYWVSKIPGFADEAISSIGITFPITFMYIALGIGLSVAGTALISQYYGNGQYETARKYATQLVVLAILIGLTLNIVSWLIAPFIFNVMGAEGYVYENAVSYIRVRSFELTAVFLFFAFRAVRQASGDTVTPTILGVSAIVINIILTGIFVLDDISIFGNTINIFNWFNLTIPQISMNGLGLGVPGAAWATLIANGIILPISIIILFKSKTGVRISLKYIKLEKVVSKDLITTALPASLGQSITAIGFAVLNTFILDYGESTYAAFQVGNRISSLFLMPVMAVGGVMASYIGQNIGNINPSRAKKAFFQGVLLSVIIMIAGSSVGLLIRQNMAGLFLIKGSESFDLAITYMLFLFMGLPLMAIYQAYIGLYNGSGRTMYTLILGLTRLWLLRLPLLLLFKYATDFGSSGIWYAMLLSNLFIAVIGFVFMRRIDYSPKIRLEPVLK